MTSFVRPSDGKVTQGRHIDMNRLGLKAGDNVIYESALSGYKGGSIKRVAGQGNEFEIGAEIVAARKVLGRIPADMPERDVIHTITLLNEAVTRRDQVRRQAWSDWEAEQARIIQEKGIR